MVVHSQQRYCDLTAGLGPFLEIEGVGEAGIVLTDTTGATPASYNIWSDAGMLKFWDSTYGHRLTLGANGGVGIGTMTPANKLEVHGDAYITGSISGSSTSTGSFGALTVGGSTLNADLVSGKVGIGTTSPTYPLHIMNYGV